MNHYSLTLRIALASLVFPLSLATSAGQEKPPLQLALKQAVKMALHENPQVQIAVLSYAESKENRTSETGGMDSPHGASFRDANDFVLTPPLAPSRKRRYRAGRPRAGRLA